MSVRCTFAELNCVLFPKRTRPGQPLAIVIHYLADDFTTVINNQIIQTPQTANYNTAVGYHYVIGDTGISTKLAEPLFQLPNLHAYSTPTWAGKPSSGNGATDPDEIVIHVALANITLPCDSYTLAQYNELVRLLCCLIAQFHTTISPDANHVLLPPGIDASQTDYYDDSEIPSQLFTDVSTCLGGGDIPLDEEEISNCCTDNAALITALAARVTTAETALATAITDIDTLQGQVADLLDWKDVIQAQVNTQQTVVDGVDAQTDNNSTYLASIKACLDLVCPTVSACAVIEYAYASSLHNQIIVPNVNRIVNFAAKISDQNPAVVRAGPLWKANLQAGVYNIVVAARFTSALWAAGNKVWLELVACGVRTRIAEVTLTAGTQVVTISSETNAYSPWDGQYEIESACPDFHIEIGTNSVSTGSKTVDNASIVITPTLD